MKFKKIEFAPSFICKQALATVSSCLISLSTGMTFGISGVMLPQLRTDKSITYNPDQESWIASISILSVILGSIFSGQIQDSYGRKAAHIVLGIPVIIGWIIIACANSTSVIIVGRFIIGLSSGANKVLTMVYVSEITEPRVRSLALLMPSIFINLGVLSSHIIGYYLYWKTSSIICVVPATASIFAFLLLRESPLWLIAKGKTDKGIQNFRWFRGTDSKSETELEIVLARRSETPKMSFKETLNVVRTKSFIKPMLILTVVVFAVQFSGINVMSFYSVDLFKKAFKGDIDPFLLTVVMDIIRMMVSIGFFVIGKFVSRRIVFLICNFGSAIFALSLVACFLTKNVSIAWLPMLCFVMYTCFSSLIVTVGWTFVPELLPNNARGFGSGVNSALSFILLFTWVKITPSVLESYGDVAMFTAFGISTFVCGLILCFVLPNTHAKTLQTIEDNFKTKNVCELNPIQNT